MLKTIPVISKTATDRSTSIISFLVLVHQMNGLIIFTLSSIAIREPLETAVIVLPALLNENGTV